MRQELQVNFYLPKAKLVRLKGFTTGTGIAVLSQKGLFVNPTVTMSLHLFSSSIDSFGNSSRKHLLEIPTIHPFSYTAFLLEIMKVILTPFFIHCFNIFCDD